MTNWYNQINVDTASRVFESSRQGCAGEQSKTEQQNYCIGEALFKLSPGSVSTWNTSFRNKHYSAEPGLFLSGAQNSGHWEIRSWLVCVRVEDVPCVKGQQDTCVFNYCLNPIPEDLTDS